MEVVATDDLSGGFRENVPAGARRGSRATCATPTSSPACGTDGPLRLRLPPRRLRGRGPLALHPRLQLPDQPRGQRQPDQPGDPARRRALRLHLVDRRLRRGPAADDRGHDAAARGPLRHLEVRGRARPRRRARDVRARLHDLPPAQRLRRAPEHRRPVPQRHRHLHERGAARASRCRSSATACRRAPSRTSPTSRRSSPAARSSPASANEIFNIGADTPYTILELAEEVADAFGVEPARRAPAGAQRGRPRLLRPRQGPRGLRPAGADRPAHRASSAWPPGSASTAPATRSSSPARSRSSATCRRAGAPKRRLTR